MTQHGKLFLDAWHEDLQAGAAERLLVLPVCAVFWSEHAKVWISAQERGKETEAEGHLLAISYSLAPVEMSPKAVLVGVVLRRGGRRGSGAVNNEGS